MLRNSAGISAAVLQNFSQARCAVVDPMLSEFLDVFTLVFAVLQLAHFSAAIIGHSSKKTVDDSLLSEPHFAEIEERDDGDGEDSDSDFHPEHSDDSGTDTDYDFQEDLREVNASAGVHVTYSSQISRESSLPPLLLLFVVRVVAVFPSRRTASWHLRVAFFSACAVSHYYGLEV